MTNKTNYIRVIFNDCTEDNFFSFGEIKCLESYTVIGGREGHAEPDRVMHTEKTAVFENCAGSKIVNGKHVPDIPDDKNYEYTRVFILANIKSISKYTTWV